MNNISWLIQNPTSALWSLILKLYLNKTSLEMIFIDLFRMYTITMVSVAETALVWRWTIGWLLNTKLGKTCKEEVVAWFEVLSKNFPGGIEKESEIFFSQDSRFSRKIRTLELTNTKQKYYPLELDVRWKIYIYNNSTSLSVRFNFRTYFCNVLWSSWM
jgi:hypothetical protein